MIDTSSSHNFIERHVESNHSWKTCRSVTKSRSLKRIYLLFPFFYFHFSFLSNSLCLFIYSLFIIFLLFIFLAATRLVDYFAFSCLFYVLYFYFSFSIFYSFLFFIILWCIYPCSFLFDFIYFKSYMDIYSSDGNLFYHILN